MGPRYILQLLFSEKSQIWKKTQQPLKLEKAREKIRPDVESLECYECFDVRLSKFKNNQILLNKIICRIIPTTKLFSG